MKKKYLCTILAAVMAGILFAGCGKSDAGSSTGNDPKSETESGTKDDGDSTEKKDVIRIGIRADMVNQLEAVRAKIEGLGYKVEESVFDDSVQPDVALAEGSLDMNWYQHGPYLESYNAENETDLVMIEPKTFYPLFAMYSDKWDTVEDIPDGATIGLCNDATNQARGLNMLQAQGLIKLDESVEVPTMYDVKDNPHKFEFIEAEMSVLPQSLGDADAICLAAGHMVNAGLSAEGYLCQSDDNDVYAVGFAVRSEDKDAEWAKEIAEVVQCDELAEYFKTEKAGTQIPCWE